jgi:hypothetical protein
MKKMKNYFLVMMVSLMMIMPALTGTNATYAKSNVTNVTLASTDWTAYGTLIVELWEMLEDAFCPETPQNRCKNGSCQSGACISFRQSCGGALNAECGQSPNR